MGRKNTFHYTRLLKALSKLQFKKPLNNQAATLSLSTMFHLGQKEACQRKTSVRAQEKVQSRSTAWSQELGWAEEPRLVQQQLRLGMTTESWDSF